jgi:acyl-coenzyme A synthetase/AMP-(fatty) acid ligase
MVTLVACAVRRQVSLLPHNHTEAALRPLRHQHADAYTIDDQWLEGLDLQQAACDDIELDAERVIAVLYTSGSTGIPVGHAKTWSTLSGSGDVDREIFAGGEALNLVATVPSQHMYGLQTSVLLPFRSRCAIHDGRPFFPADIVDALASVPEPRALISTPTHLRACLAAGVRLPEVRFVLSATAPLLSAQARDAESSWHTQVLEIYGSTEAGTIGTRRTVDGDDWRVTPGGALAADRDGCQYQARYMARPLPLADRIESRDDGRFWLRGRTADYIKIAGKRATLGELTHALLGIDGVEDGVVLLPPDAQRTVALVVAPGRSREQILTALRTQLDPVFLPRPLLHVERLPRSEVGKLNLTELLELARTAGSGAHG